jgi:hypothetical protein
MAMPEAKKMSVSEFKLQMLNIPSKVALKRAFDIINCTSLSLQNLNSLN